MNWSEQVDGYCERLDFAYWAEPVNAVTNLAFIIAALIMWRRAGTGPARIMTAILFCIGVGSYLFHTHATRWAGLADVAPIGIFILTYLFFVNRYVVGWPLWASALGTAAFLPYAAVLVPILDGVPFLAISNFYWTVPILLVVYAIMLRRRLPDVARGFVIGAAILCLSITIRSVDLVWCEAWPLGTHFGWHILNGIMLGWMIEVLNRHLEARRSQG